jgi:YtkA-like
VKTLALLLAALGLSFAQEHQGNFVIRFEPTAALQANAEIPFEIRISDDLRKPIINAKVTLQIETPQHTQVSVYKATATDTGVYVAKPVFPAAGQWSVYVEVRRDGDMSARTIDFNVPASASP